MAAPVAYERTQAKGQIWAAAGAYATATVRATGNPSHVCNLHHSSWQCQILNPLSEARDGNGIHAVTSQFISTVPQRELPTVLIFSWPEGYLCFRELNRPDGSVRQCSEVATSPGWSGSITHDDTFMAALLLRPSPPYTSIASSIINITHQNGTFFTKDEPTLTLWSPKVHSLS